MPNVFSYASPEQVFNDKANFARKNIARGRPVIALEYEQGIVVLAENPSSMLHKVSEVYDRIAFAGVGKYSEYEQLRIAGIRLAEVTGYQYGRDDVTAKSLANYYSQMLDQIFREAFKPFEVEILVCEVGGHDAASQMYRVDFSGIISDEERFVALGGQGDELRTALQQGYGGAGALPEVVAVGANALRGLDSSRELTAAHLEAAVLDRSLGRRKFRRLSPAELEAAIG